MQKATSHDVALVELESHPSEILTVLSPLFLFRLAGLPTESLRAIESKRLRALSYNVDQYEKTLSALADPLNALLHQLISILAKDEALRDDVRMLIELKRAVHNARLPKSQRAIEVAKRHFASEQMGLLETWVKAGQGLKECNVRSAEALALDLEESRAAIQAWSKTPAFRRALQIANAQLEETLDRYLSRTDVEITHKHRLLDSALYGYFLRASTKTSPFSTFGIVSYGLWSGLESKQPPHLAHDIGYKTKARLNAALLSRMATSIQRVKTSLGVVGLKLNPTCAIRGDRVHFLRMRSRPLDRLMAFGAITSHSMFSVALTPTLQQMLNLFNDTGEMTMRTLIHQMSDCTSVDATKLAGWVAYLIEVSLLESSDAYDAGSYQSFLKHVRSGALAIDSEVLSGFIERADAMTEQMDTDDIVKRRALIAGIRVAAQNLAREAPDMQLHKLDTSTIFYEDAALTGSRHALPLPGNAEFVDNLKLLQQLQPIFDMNAPLRAALTEYFKKRFGTNGECLDVPRFSEEFARECAGPFLNASAEAKTIELFDSRLDKHAGNIQASRVLHCLRNLSVRYIRKLGRTHASGEVAIDPNALSRLRTHMPTRLHSIYSGSFFIQHCMQEGSQAKWVLNKIYGGSGQLMSRLLYLWESDAGDLATRILRKYIADNVPADTVVAELPGNGDSNLNFHSNLVDCVIGGLGGSDPQQKRTAIALGDLRMRHDALSDTLTLFSVSTGKRILPVYLGGLVSQLLPDVQKLLLLFGPSISMAVPTWNSVFPGHKSESILCYPRLSVGNIVVMRKMWAIPPDAVPRRAAGEGEADLYMRVLKWVKIGDLPTRCYITFSRKPQDGSAVEVKPRKPMFFDFESIRSLLSFQKEMEKHDGVLWLAEALPDPSPNAVIARQTVGKMRHHCEYVFDLTSTARH